ncbi:MAG: sn-glycerol-3-phosphate ABC transporter ATP-binding protein UgpC [Tissierellia bacterium]|nr:sn-glycerol-3-phosphate ABC transporter ATP-binding protein UgpC [Tissierellia bacterium]
MAGLSFRHMYKIYDGNVVAVKDFNLEIEDKEFIVFVGPSGCGKSTTLRMVAGLEEISKGELYIDDVLVNDIEPKERDIAMVFQNYALYPHMTVRDNMSYALRLKKLPKEEIDEKVAMAANILGLEDYLDRKPKALSGGQRQRVALGRAIVRSPKVFLMDEPLSNLDAKLRVQTRSEIVKLHKQLETTFIYVTHDQTEAMTMGDRIVIMKDGIVQQVDTPHNVYFYPENQFVAGFIGSPQMNFVDAEVFKKDDEYYVMTLGTELLIPKEKGRLIEERGELNKKLIMGIRPEHIYDHIRQTDMKIKGKVDLMELLGSEKHLHIIVNGTKLVARINSDNPVETDDEIEMYLDGTKLHFFDGESELNISLEDLEKRI